MRSELVKIKMHPEIKKRLQKLEKFYADKSQNDLIEHLIVAEYNQLFWQEDLMEGLIESGDIKE